MGWSETMMNAIAGTNIRPRFVLETLVTPGFKALGTPLRLASFYNTSGYANVLTLDGNSITAGVLEIGDWTFSVSELTLGYRGTLELRSQVTRGQLVQLKWGIAGWAIGDFEPIFTGHIQGISRGSGDRWSISVRSALASLVSRLTEETGESELFHDLVSTTVATVPHISAATAIGLASTVGLNNLTGGDYLVAVTGDDGEIFYLQGETLVGGTGLDDLVGAILGTTDAAANIGNEARHCALFEQHPIDVARTVLTSTGAGTNGDFDLAPASWGVGLPADAVDDDDCDYTRDWVAPGTPWHVFASDQQSDGLSWLQSVLGPAGLILCERQGRISVRAITDPSVSHPYYTQTVTDHDLLEGPTYETWDPGSPVEYGEVRIRTPDGSQLSVAETFATRPALVRRVLRLDYIEDSQSAWRDSIEERVAPWSTRIAEVVTVRCRGLRLARMAPGDHLILDSRHWSSRVNYIGGPPKMMVLSVEPDWWAGTVTIRAAHVPQTATES